LVPGLETENGYIKVNSRMETAIPGLYAAGDCIGLPLQISKAVGEGLIAAQNAAKYLDSETKQ
jgi:thioredoxin reductase (NADPH)